MRIIRLFERIGLFLISTILLTNYIFSSNLTTNVPVYNSNAKEKRKIALTFDDGPHPRKTPEILKVLKKHDIKATFFIIGINAKNYPETLSLVINDGHEIGNHTFSHRLLKSKTKEEISKEIIDTELMIEERNGTSEKIIRPPCGIYDQSLVDFANERGYKIVLWSIDTNDWAHASYESIIDVIDKNIVGGDILLFHDYISGESNSIKALNYIIPRLKGLGYEFVTVSDLLKNA